MGKQRLSDESAPQPPSAAPAPVSRGYVRSFAVRVGCYFGFYLGLNGVYLPFFPLWLAHRGFDADQIAICLGATQMLRICFQPVASILGDRFAHRRTAVTLFSFVALAVFLSSGISTGFAALAITTTIAFVSWHMALPPIEALALTGTRQFGLDYGRMRLFGSVGFIIVGLVGGAVIEAVGLPSVYWMLLSIFVAGSAMSLFLPVTPQAVRRVDDATKPKAQPMRELLAKRPLIALMAANALVQASHGIIYGFGSIYWEAIGLSKFEIGVLWSVGVLAEISLFAFSGLAGRTFGPYGLLVFGAGAAALRWALFPLEFGFWGYFFLQMLHGLSFGASFLGVQRAVLTRVPESHTASSQGLSYMMNALLLAFSTFFAGPLYRTFDGTAFWTMLVPVAAAIAILAMPSVRRTRVGG